MLSAGVEATAELELEAVKLLPVMPQAATEPRTGVEGIVRLEERIRAAAALASTTVQDWCCCAKNEDSDNSTRERRPSNSIWSLPLELNGLSVDLEDEGEMGWGLD